MIPSAISLESGKLYVSGGGRVVAVALLNQDQQLYQGDDSIIYHSNGQWIRPQRRQKLLDGDLFREAASIRPEECSGDLHWAIARATFLASDAFKVLMGKRDDGSLDESEIVRVVDRYVTETAGSRRFMGGLVQMGRRLLEIARG